MKKENINIIKVLLKNKKVNNYTKMLILLNTLNYYEDYYIPNKKLMNQLGITKAYVIRLLKKLENDNVIKIFYKGRKKYFTFLLKNNDEEKEERPVNNNDLFDYDWLNEEWFMIEDELSHTVDFITDGLNNYIELFWNTRPRYIYRKIRFKRKFYKKYMLIYNPIHDLLPSPIIVNMMTRRLLKTSE